jgi:hypothetical protein
MFGSVKSALGWYATRRKGGRLAQLEVGERVQEAPIIAEEQHRQIADTLSSCTPGVRNLLIDWADRSDYAVHLGPMASRELRRVARELRFKGLVARKVVAVKVEERVFVDLNTGEEIKTKGSR